MRPPCCFDNPLQMAQTNPGALVVLPRVQPLEHLEHAVGKLHVDPDAIVADGEEPGVRCRGRGQRECRGSGVEGQDPDPLKRELPTFGVPPSGGPEQAEPASVVIRHWSLGEEEERLSSGAPFPNDE